MHRVEKSTGLPDASEFRASKGGDSGQAPSFLQSGPQNFSLGASAPRGKNAVTPSSNDEDT